MTKPKRKSLPPATFMIPAFQSKNIQDLIFKYGFNDTQNFMLDMENLHTRVHSMAKLRMNEPNLSDIKELLFKISDKSIAVSNFINLYLTNLDMIDSNAYNLGLCLNNYKPILNLLEFDLQFWISGMKGETNYQKFWVRKIEMLRKNVELVSSRITFNNIHERYYNPLIKYRYKILSCKQKRG